MVGSRDWAQAKDGERVSDAKSEKSTSSTIRSELTFFFGELPYLAVDWDTTPVGALATFVPFFVGEETSFFGDAKENILGVCRGEVRSGATGTVVAAFFPRKPKYVREATFCGGGVVTSLPRFDARNTLCKPSGTLCGGWSLR
jgi:hypothetical protein